MFMFAKEGAVPTSEIFCQKVLVDIQGFKAEDFYCLISLTHRFDVSFQLAERLAEFWVWQTTAHSARSLADWAVEALSDQERFVTVCLHNESITDYDMKYWLSRYGDVKTPPWYFRNGQGIWIGTRQFCVKFRVKEDGMVTPHP